MKRISRNIEFGLLPEYLSSKKNFLTSYNATSDIGQAFLKKYASLGYASGLNEMLLVSKFTMSQQDSIGTAIKRAGLVDDQIYKVMDHLNSKFMGSVPDFESITNEIANQAWADSEAEAKLSIKQSPIDVAQKFTNSTMTLCIVCLLGASFIVWKILK